MLPKRRSGRFQGSEGVHTIDVEGQSSLTCLPCRPSSLLKNPIYCDRLQSPLASFSTLDDLNMTCGHSFRHLRPRASPTSISLNLVTSEFFNRLLRVQAHAWSDSAGGPDPDKAVVLDG